MKYVTAINCMYAVLVLGAVMTLLSVLVRSRSSKSKIHLDDLLLGDDGRISRSAVVMMGSFMLSCWMMIYLLASGKMTEGYIGLFLASWVTPGVVNKFARGNNSTYNQVVTPQKQDEPPVYNREETYR